MERKINFKSLVKKTQWRIIKQFCLSVVIAYIIPISTISIDVHTDSQLFGQELIVVFFNVFSWIYICISLIVIVSINVTSLLKKVRQEMDIVYHSSMWLTSGNSSSKLTLHEFIETNRHIETMQQKIKNMIQIEKYQKEDILFKVSAMAHDLKTPLTVIQGNSELLQFSSLSEVDEQCLRDIEKASNQLENYFNQLINYSKTVYDDQVSLSQYSVKDLAAIIEQECTYLIGEKIDYKYMSRLDFDYQIYVDLDLIIRSIANIINNAVAYADNTGKKITIILEEEQGNLDISIWNNGSAFSEEVLSNFGKLFYREDTSRNYQMEHFGIGLAFVKQVMALHSGEIRLQNIDNGAMVKLTIPMRMND